MMKKSFLFFTFISLFLITACDKCNKENPLKIDVSEIKVNLKIERFEKDLFSTTPDSISIKLPVLRKKYGSFFDSFIQHVVATGKLKDSLLIFNMLRYVNDPDMKALYKEVDKIYPDISFLENDIANCFKHYKFYFTAKPLPKIYTCISGFNYNIINTDSAIAICLDMYLGSDCRFYSMLNLPRYLTNRMRKEYMVADCMKGLAMSEYEYKSKTNDLINQMVYHGKIIYFADAMLPDLADTLKTGYTHKQNEWCIKNEANVWAFFIEKQLLFLPMSKRASKFIDEAPFTSEISKDAPGKLGVWVGWQIVKAYMKNNSKVTMSQLMEEQDGNKILNLSRYKPKL